MDFAVAPIKTSYLDPSQVGTAATSSVGGTTPVNMSDSRPVPAPAHDPIQDTVKLSTTSQVQAMKQGGASVTQIAANLGLTTAEVNQDLGITSSSSSSEASVLAALSAKK